MVIDALIDAALTKTSVSRDDLEAWADTVSPVIAAGTPGEIVIVQDDGGYCILTQLIAVAIGKAPRIRVYDQFVEMGDYWRKVLSVIGFPENRLHLVKGNPLETVKEYPPEKVACIKLPDDENFFTILDILEPLMEEV